MGKPPGIPPRAGALRAVNETAASLALRGVCFGLTLLLPGEEPTLHARSRALDQAPRVEVGRSRPVPTFPMPLPYGHRALGAQRTNWQMFVQHVTPVKPQKTNLQGLC